MKILDAQFIKSCTDAEQLPQDSAAEIAIVGRSNVGKSSLINSLLQRRKLANVSGTPGKTRLLNVIRVYTDHPTMRTVNVIDLPGYGYAKVSRSVREQWGPMIERYLITRQQLSGVLMLVDVRWLEAQDRNTVVWLRRIHRDPILIITKIDKIPRSQRAARVLQLREALDVPASSDVILYSSVTHDGREEVWRAIRKLVRREG